MVMNFMLISSCTRQVFFYRLVMWKKYFQITSILFKQLLCLSFHQVFSHNKMEISWAKYLVKWENINWSTIKYPAHKYLLHHCWHKSFREIICNTRPNRVQKLPYPIHKPRTAIALHWFQSSDRILKEI